LNTYIRSWEQINEGSDIIYGIHGVKKNSIWSTCQNGLVPTFQTDVGLYGQGIYFTNLLDYAVVYSYMNEKEEYPILVCAVILGNSNIMLDSDYENGRGKYVGKPIDIGYQSHFAVVYKKDIYTKDPIKKIARGGYPINLCTPETFAYEIVVRDSGQVLPLFALFVKKAL